MVVQYELPAAPAVRPNPVTVRLSDVEFGRLEALVEWLQRKRTSREPEVSRADVLRWGLDLLWANFGRDVNP